MIFLHHIHYDECTSFVPNKVENFYFFDGAYSRNDPLFLHLATESLAYFILIFISLLPEIHIFVFK